MSGIALPQNVQNFLHSESGSHLFLLMIENALGNSLQQIRPLERVQFEQEYGGTTPVEFDFELLLTHLSRIRVVADLNSHAEDCLVNYWGTKYESGEVFLADARRYVVDALRIAPRNHPERARAYKNLAYLLLARNKTKEACARIGQALEIFTENGLMEQIEELLEMLSTRTEDECKLLQENVAAVIREMEVERS